MVWWISKKNINIKWKIRKTVMKAFVILVVIQLLEKNKDETKIR